MIRHRRKHFRANEFITTWVTSSPSETITLPLRSGYSYNMTVDWGDGSTSEITAWDDADKTHTFVSAGTQIISISGTCESWYFNDGGDKLKFRTVESWGKIIFTALDHAFHGCENVTSFAEEGLQYSGTSLTRTWTNCFSALSFPEVNALTSVTSLNRTWANCSSATSFPEVNALTSVTDLYCTWYKCSSATSFPDVNDLTNVTGLENTWRYCSSATSFPEVNALTSVTSLYATWYYCSACTTVPVLMASSTALTNTEHAFDGIGSGMEGEVVELWDTNNFPNITDHADTFDDATGLDNYADIPEDWK